ncbi:MAG TPA: hypothetical protein VLG74_15035, partial [Blastocatellia bacterium]|nr:hypothetical protein [Blastocatellia bacterium]
GIMAFGGATVVCIIGLLVWLLLSLSGYQTVRTQDKSEKKQVRDNAPSQLPPSPINMPSVTENTTRNFDPAVYREKDIRD